MLLVVFVIGLSAYGIWSFSTLNDLKVDGPIYQRIVQSKDLIADILPPPAYIIESHLVALQAVSAAPDERKALVARLKILKGDYDKRHAFWAEQDLGDELEDHLLNISDKPAQEFYQIAFNQFIPALERGDGKAAAVAFDAMKQNYELHRTAINKTVELAVKRYKADEVYAITKFEESKLGMLARLIAVMGVVALLLMVIRYSLLRQLGGEPAVAVKVARRIAEGDFTVPIETGENDKSSLLFAMKHMCKGLTNIVSDVRGATDSICTAAQQIAVGNSDFSRRTEAQAASLEETASSMEELTSTVRQNAENAKQANQLAEMASAAAMRGAEATASMIGNMDEISNASKKIVDIIGVIDDIAFQTNILALNAAVEAARAGEQGRGFAVVASEVRNLAQRSAAAAKEIKMLIGDSVGKVTSGSQLLESTVEVISEVVGEVRRVTNLIAEISVASKEQELGIDQVNQAVMEMDEGIQQNAALMEEATAAAELMLEQANDLRATVSIFKLEMAKRHLPEMANSGQPVASPVSASSRAIPAASPPRNARRLAKAADDADEWKEF